MYDMTSYGNIIADELINSMLDYAGSKKKQYQMYIYYKYVPDGSELVLLSYVDDCVYWYTYEWLDKWFVDTLVKSVHVNFLGYARWFISIGISQLKDCSIYVDQARYSTSVVSKYLDTATVKEILRFHKEYLASWYDIH